MKLLNERMKYGLELYLLSIDEGITGYRDDSLETVKANQVEYSLPLEILSYQDLYGWTMDQIVKEVGLKNNCTFCGVFRRQALDRGAALLGCDIIVTGHNADDVAETILMNLLRGDISRLKRATSIITGSKSSSLHSSTEEESSLIPRCKPFKYTYEKEIVMYAYFKKLNYFSTECIYSPNSYRGFARSFLKDLESIRASSILDIIHSAEQMCVKDDVRLPPQGYCSRCGYISSQNICKACVLLQGLNSGLPKLGVGKSSKVPMIKGHPSLMVTQSSSLKSSCQRVEKGVCCSSKNVKDKPSTCCSTVSPCMNVSKTVSERTDVLNEMNHSCNEPTEQL